MCYLVAKKHQQSGSIALKVQNRTELAKFSYDLYKKLGEDIHLITLSSPSAYHEYAPYAFVHNYNNSEKSISSCNHHDF